MISIIGIDLSGPTNVKDTSLIAVVEEEGRLMYRGSRSGADDAEIVEFIQSNGLGNDVVIGMDAPLSYNVGGGDRPGDTELRKRITSIGMRSGSIMPPTMTRMAYLTLRGMAIARLIRSLNAKAKIVEVHPGAALALHGAPVDDVIELKRSAESRARLLSWLEGQGMPTMYREAEVTDHDIASCAAAFAAWKWSSGQSAWIMPACFPYHPFDYAC